MFSAAASSLTVAKRPVSIIRRQAEALRAQIARLEAENDGRDSLRSQPRRGSIQGGLVGTAQQQAGMDRAARLEELRRQYTEAGQGAEVVFHQHRPGDADPPGEGLQERDLLALGHPPQHLAKSLPRWLESRVRTRTAPPGSPPGSSAAVPPPAPTPRAG